MTLSIPLETPLLGHEDEWMGTYTLSDDCRLRCHDCWQFDPDDWDNDETIVGSVYYEIDIRKESGWVTDIDGGEYGYTSDDTFGDFLAWLKDVSGYGVLNKTSENDDEDAE